MKKAQVEMIGIALVIVLLILGLGFFLSRSLAPSDDLHGTYVRKQLSQNTLDVLIKTVTDCRGLDFVTLFEDCGNNDFAGGSIQCAGHGSCGYIHGKIDYILNQTLAVRKFPYVFVVYKGDDEYNDHLFKVETKASIAGINCTLRNIQLARVTVETPGIQPLPLYPAGTMNLKLYICTGNY